MPDTGFTPAVRVATQPIFERLKHVIPEAEWPFHAPLIARISELKETRNAVLATKRAFMGGRHDGIRGGAGMVNATPE